MTTESKVMSVSFRTQRRGDVESPGVASCSRHGPWRSRVEVDVVREAKLEVWQLSQTVGHNKIVAIMKKAPDVAVLTSRPGVKHMIRCC
jgi:hypothetical protein